MIAYFGKKKPKKVGGEISLRRFFFVFLFHVYLFVLLQTSKENVHVRTCRPEPQGSTLQILSKNKKNAHKTHFLFLQIQMPTTVPMMKESNTLQMREKNKRGVKDNVKDSQNKQNIKTKHNQAPDMRMRRALWFRTQPKKRFDVSVKSFCKYLMKTANMCSCLNVCLKTARLFFAFDSRNHELSVHAKRKKFSKPRINLKTKMFEPLSALPTFF